MSEPSRYLWGMMRRQRFGVVWAVVSGLSWQGAAIAAPLLVRYAIDTGIIDGDRRALYLSAVGIALLGLTEAVAGGARHYFAIRNRSRTDADVRDAIFRRALELDARYHDRVGAGELISRASNDAELVARLLDAIGHTVGALLTVVGASAMLFVIEPRLAAVVLIPLPLLTIGFWRYSSRYARRTKVLQEELGASSRASAPATRSRAVFARAATLSSPARSTSRTSMRSSSRRSRCCR